MGSDSKAIFFLIIPFILYQYECLLNTGLGSQDEQNLVKTLFDGYNPLIRPVNNMSELVTVEFQMALHQLIDVDEKNQILKSNVWLRMVWHDYQLMWESADYGGISVIRVEPDKVWKPDIVLFNNADGKYEVSFKPNLLIYEKGKVMWIPPAIYKSSCTIKVEYFPFDEQQCEMNFGSWTFNNLQVVIDYYDGQKKVDLEDYAPSGSWDLIACPGKMKSQDKDGKHNTSMITYTLTIRRKTLFYTVNLILPCCLITFLSFCVFFLPADAIEKMTMCISILLALVVFQVLVSKILPPTSVTTPLIAKYLLFTFIMNFLTILITVAIINWNFRTPRTHRMARWIRRVFLNYLPRLILMKRPDLEKRWGEKNYSIHHDSYRRQNNKSLNNTSPTKQQIVQPITILNNDTNSIKTLQKNNLSSSAYHFINTDESKINDNRLISEYEKDKSLMADYYNNQMPQRSNGSLTNKKQNPDSENDFKKNDKNLLKNININTRNKLYSDSNLEKDYNFTNFANEETNFNDCLSNSLKKPKLCITDQNKRLKNSSLSTTESENSETDSNISNEETSDDEVWEKDDKDKSFPITKETFKAMEAIKFVASHLKNEDDYSEILDDWRYVASVIDRLQLFIFVAITVGGTIGILINAPHIFETVDQEKVIQVIKASEDGVGLIPQY